MQNAASEPSKSFARAQPQVVEIEEKTAPPAFRGTGYEAAVRRCAGLIVDGRAKPTELHRVQEQFGLSRPRIRQAYYEAARHLRYDMGGLLERQEASIGWVVKHRDEASEKAGAREAQAAKWREDERRAHEDAQALEDAEARIAALDAAARMGATASKYGLEAEKWAAQALSHQKHLDDIQCLLGPKELSLTQNNISFDGVAMVERLGKMLAAKFAGRADLVREIEETVSALLLGDVGDSGDAAAITVAGETA